MKSSQKRPLTIFEGRKDEWTSSGRKKDGTYFLLVCYPSSATVNYQPKYYTTFDLRSREYLKNTNYLHIRTDGVGKLPRRQSFKKFNTSLDTAMSDAKQSEKVQVVIVHCKHGLNRTGFFICNWLIKSVGIKPTTAIKLFENARGYTIRYEQVRKYLRGEESNLRASKIYSDD